MKIKSFSLDELPLFSEWPARITGNSDIKQFHKNKKEVEREYDREKWKTLLEKAKSAKKNVGINDVDILFSGIQKNICFNRGKFVLLTPSDSRRTYRSLISDYLKRMGKHSPVVELGSGYGSVILGLAKEREFRKNRFFAAELSTNGRSLTKLIATNEKLNVPVLKCDLTKKSIINGIPESAIIITSESVLYQPHLSTQFVDSMIELKPKIVIHFEPIYEHCDTKSLFGQLRKRYIEINDYNRNLLTVLNRAERENKIDIIKVDPVIFGENPLLVVSVIIWRPKNTKYHHKPRKSLKEKNHSNKDL